MVLTAIGSLMWNATLLAAGYLLGANWHLMADIVGVFIYVVFGVAVYFVVRRVRSKRVAPEEM